MPMVRLLVAFLCLQSLGQVGQVISVLSNGNCFVEVSGLFWELNPKALVPASREFLSNVPGLYAFFYINR